MTENMKGILSLAFLIFLYQVTRRNAEKNNSEMLLNFIIKAKYIFIITIVCIIFFMLLVDGKILATIIFSAIVITLVIWWWKVTDESIKKTLEENRPEGYEDIFSGTYIRGLRDVLSGSEVFVTVCMDRMILGLDGRSPYKQEVSYNSVYSAKIVGKSHVQQRYSAGKLFVYGKYAMSMDKERMTVYENYLEITYEDVNCGKSKLVLKPRDNYDEKKYLEFVQRMQFLGK